MANICDNRFYFRCEHNADKYINEFKRLQDNAYGVFEFEVLDFDDDYCSIEGFFESKWNFPMEDFESIFINTTSDNPNECYLDECYFRCLSEEYGCDYVAMNIYSNGSWRDEQCFDL